ISFASWRVARVPPTSSCGRPPTSGSRRTSSRSARGTGSTRCVAISPRPHWDSAPATRRSWGAPTSTTWRRSTTSRRQRKTTSMRTSTERATLSSWRNESERASTTLARSAVAGSRWKGKFSEQMFAEGQVLDHAYYRTKYDAEKIVRESPARFRIYRPGLVIGSSETGEADRIDGPYYGFKFIQRLRNAIPPWVPLVGLEGGEVNVVPVDFVARALDAIGHREGLDGMTFHLTDPAVRRLGEVTNEFCRAAHAPQFTLRIDSRAGAMLPQEATSMLEHWKVAQTLKRRLLD